MKKSKNKKSQKAPVTFEAKVIVLTMPTLAFGIEFKIKLRQSSNRVAVYHYKLKLVLFQFVELANSR